MVNTVISDLDSEKTLVAPYCYKIKEGCLPCSKSTDNVNVTPTTSSQPKCINILSKYMKLSEPWAKDKKDKMYDKLFECLKQYGDIYKKLNIELYVNPKTKQITFPDNQRIQANLNKFLRNVNTDTKSPKEYNENEYKLELYNVLLNDSLRKLYNEFYNSYGYSELSSILPKEYGIARLLGPESSGGKIKKQTKRRKYKLTKRKSSKRRRSIKRRT